MSTALRNNIIGLLLAPTEEFEMLKLGHVLALAKAAGINVEEEEKEYMKLRELRTLGRQYLRGSPKFLAEASRLQFHVLSATLGKIWQEKPGILEEASEKLTEINLADLVRREKNAE
jgi:hypothetical protein